MSRLEGKVVLVTGGASGIGEAIVRRTAEEGATVVIADKERQLGAATAAELGADFIEHDVCDEAGWSHVIEETEVRHGKLDVLVNNAGIYGATVGVDEATLDEWRRIFSINVDGVFLGCRAALPALMRAGGGSIVNISSVAAMIATPYRVPYGASKSAVRQLTKSVAQFCAQKKMNVRVNSVHPGNVRTATWDRDAEASAAAYGVTFDEYVAQRQAMVPLGDFTKAEDVAAAVAYLASEDARHVTGAALVVDGGLFNCDTYRP